MTSTAPHDDDRDVTAELEALVEQQHTAHAATVQARDELAAARAARASAVVDGTMTAQHIERLADARDDLEVCEDVELELTRRRRTLAGDAPATASESGDSRTVRVRVLGRTGTHSCNQPSTGRHLIGGDELTIPADDALSLAQGGHISVLEQPVPKWWPRHIPAVLDDSALRALAGR